MIRSARAEDAPALAALVTELEFPATEGELAPRLAALQAAGEIVLVAELDGRAVALLTAHVTPVLHRPTAVGRITALVVTASARGRGVGRALVRAAEELLAARGCALVEVTSHRRLVEAHAFYERIGYEVTSLRFKRSLAPPV